MSFTADYVDGGCGVLSVGAGVLTSQEIIAVKGDLLADQERSPDSRAR